MIHPSRSNEGADRDRPPISRSEDRLLTVPNVLCMVRLVASLGLIALALLHEPLWFLLLFLLLAVTDWLDGKLARWLEQRSTLGPRLDTAADVGLYASLLLGSLWLKRELLLPEWPWIAAAVGSYAISCAFAALKYGRLPSYHTRTAKMAWGFMIAAVVSLVFEWSVWPLRVAMVVVLIANLEGILLTARLPTWQTNVPSLLHAKRNERA